MFGLSKKNDDAQPKPPSVAARRAAGLAVASALTVGGVASLINTPTPPSQPGFEVGVTQDGQPEPQSGETPMVDNTTTDPVEPAVVLGEGGITTPHQNTGEHGVAVLPRSGNSPETLEATGPADQIGLISAHVADGSSQFPRQ